MRKPKRTLPALPGRGGAYVRHKNGALKPETPAKPEPAKPEPAKPQQDKT